MSFKYPFEILPANFLDLVIIKFPFLHPGNNFRHIRYGGNALRHGRNTIKIRTKSYKIFTNQKLTNRLTAYLRKKIIKKELFKKVSFEEFLLATSGYGVSRVAVTSKSPVLNKTLLDADIRKFDINILAIVRGVKTIPNPKANEKIALGDELICFGKLENIRDKICVPAI